MVTDNSSEIILCKIDGTTLEVIVEDDDRVAYAYLRDSGAIVSDVWLYNVVPTPETVDWRDQDQMPFLNPRKYCKQGDLPRIVEPARVSCAQVSDRFELRYDGELIAQLQPGARPGWSKLAAEDGPLALRLD